MPLNMQTSSPRGSETVLLVDAEPEPRKLAIFMLQRQGYTILEARNGVEAMTLFEKHNSEVALLLTEVRRRGWQLAAKLQELHPKLRVLYMSDSEGAEVRSVVEQGMPFLKKPFTMHEIAEAVHQALNDPREKAMAA